MARSFILNNLSLIAVHIYQDSGQLRAEVEYYVTASDGSHAERGVQTISLNPTQQTQINTLISAAINFAKNREGIN